MTKVSVFVLSILTSFAFNHLAQAKQITCSSKKEVELYFSTVQINFAADIKNNVTLENISLSLVGDSKMGGRENRVEGKATKKYVRFSLYGDHVCSYKLTLRKGFENFKTTTAYLDAFCEDNHNSAHKLSCKLN